VGCKWAATRTHTLCFQNSRTATRVPSPIEQSHHPNVTSAAHRHRRIDRSSNSVQATVTVPNTQHPTLTTAVYTQQSTCRKVSKLWLSLRRAYTAPFRYKREITNVLNKRPFCHTCGGHQTRVARSKMVRDFNVGCKWAATRTHSLCFQNSRTATSDSSPTEQPHHPNVTSAAHRHRRIDRSSNSVETTVTVPNTQQSPPAFTTNRVHVARSASCGWHYAERPRHRFGTIERSPTS
jgi:hypothetical protein